MKTVDNNIKMTAEEIMMEEFYSKILEYSPLILDADDFISIDMNVGVVKVDIGVFDDFQENAIINIYCADINANSIMEFTMKEEDDEGIIMEWLDSYTIE